MKKYSAHIFKRHDRQLQQQEEEKEKKEEEEEEEEEEEAVSYTHLTLPTIYSV